MTAPKATDARDLHKWILEHLPHVRAIVALGSEKLYIYVQSRGKHVDECPTEWNDIPVEATWTGPAIPRSRP